MPDNDQEFDSRATDRLTLFSDAVVAIAITLLAIDLPVPAGATTSAFLASVRDNWGHYGAFLISFLAIAGAWSNHHEVFKRTTRTDARLRHLDMMWLLMIVLTPFATRFLTAQGHPSTTVHALRFSFYALVQVAESAILLGMLRYMTAHGMSRDLPEQTVRDVTTQACLLMAGFTVSIPVLFVTYWGWLLWFVVPFAISRWLASRRKPRETSHARWKRRSGKTRAPDAARRPGKPPG
ncbi:MAG TPA: TMEM175 family protein [Trebonia sp.]